MEERQESNLRSAKSKLNDCRQSLKEMLRQEIGLAGLASSRNEVIPAIDLHVAEMRRRMVVEMISGLRTSLVRLSEIVAVEYGKLMPARQEREKIESIRDSAGALWVRQRARREQLWLDEMFLMRRR